MPPGLEDDHEEPEGADQQRVRQPADEPAIGAVFDRAVDVCGGGVRHAKPPNRHCNLAGLRCEIKGSQRLCRPKCPAAPMCSHALTFKSMSKRRLKASFRRSN